MKSKRTVFITGVCGCIGSHLLDELLARNERVIGVDDLSYGKLENIRPHLSNKNFRFIKLNVLNLKALKKAAATSDIILHTASVKKVGENQPAWPTLTVNTQGTENVLKAALARKSKVIIFSTSDVYGTSEQLPFKEDGDCVIGASTAKRWAYAVSKLYSEQIALSYWKDLGVPVVVLRYFGVFSERSSTGWSGGPIPSFVKLVLEGKALDIHGDGSQTRCMGYVSDTVNATLLAMDCKKAIGEIINIGSNEEHSILQTAKLIHKLSGVKTPLKLNYIPMKQIFGEYKEIKRRIPDLVKAKKILGYRPQITYREGLKRVIDAYKSLL